MVREIPFQGSDDPLKSNVHKEVVDEWEYRSHRCGIAINTLQGTWLGYCQTVADDASEEVARHYWGKVVGDPPNEITFVNQKGFVGFDCGHARQRCIDENGKPLEGEVNDMLSTDAPWFPGDGDGEKWGPDDVRQTIESIVDDMIDFEQTLSNDR